MGFERDLRRLGACSFCVHATHDFPSDAFHEERHARGWHTCEMDGLFRQNKWHCRDYQRGGGAVISW